MRRLTVRIGLVFLLLLLFTACGRRKMDDSEKITTEIESASSTEESKSTEDKESSVSGTSLPSQNKDDDISENITNNEADSSGETSSEETDKGKETENSSGKSEPVDETTEMTSSERKEPSSEVSQESSTAPDSHKVYTSSTPVEEVLKNMSPQEKVRLLFITSTKDYRNEPCGGTIYFESDVTEETGTKAALASDNERSLEVFGLPAFLCVDEEGGRVARVANAPGFSVPRFENMSVYGAEGNRETAQQIGTTIGSYLKELGFNVDFAPVADVLSNPLNTVVAVRSFGSDAARVGSMCAAVSDGLLSQGVFSCYKHFPGHGQTEGDTHLGFAYTSKTIEEMRECELLPFKEAAERGVPFIMVSHISCPSVTGDETPAVFSDTLVNGVLRTELGYQGIIITDGMNMGAIKNHYGSAEAAVRAFSAGCDMILLPSDHEEAYQGLLKAVTDGQISEERLNASVRRIIALKLRLM